MSDENDKVTSIIHENPSPEKIEHLKQLLNQCCLRDEQGRPKPGQGLQLLMSDDGTVCHAAQLDILTGENP